MSLDPQALIDKGLSLWSSDRRAAEKAFVEVYWKHEGTREAELAQAYLYKLRSGDPSPDQSRMEPDFDGIVQGGQNWFRAQYQAMANLYLIVFAVIVFVVLANLKYIIRGSVSISVLAPIALLSLPAILIFPRVLRRYRRGYALISDEFAQAKPGLGVGKLFVWIGTIGVVLSLAVILWALVTGQTGVPAGLGIGLSMWPLMIGILIIEVRYRLWARKSGLR